MLLKMRSLPPKATPGPDGVLRAVEGSDESAIRWLDMIRVTRKYAWFIEFASNNAAQYLEQRQAAIYDPNDSRSFDLRYGAKLIPMVNL